MDEAACGEYSIKKIRGDLAGVLRGDDLLVNLLRGEQTGLWYACVLGYFT